MPATKIVRGGYQDAAKKHDQSMRNIDESRRAMHKILVWREMARPLPDGGAGERERGP